MALSNIRVCPERMGQLEATRAVCAPLPTRIKAVPVPAFVTISAEHPISAAFNAVLELVEVAETVFDPAADGVKLFVLAMPAPLLNYNLLHAHPCNNNNSISSSSLSSPTNGL